MSYTKGDQMRDEWYESNLKVIHTSLNTAISAFDDRQREGLCGGDEKLEEVMRKVLEYFSGEQSPATAEIL